METMAPWMLNFPHIVRFQSRAESFQPRNKYGSWVASSHAGGASTSGVWDSYLSMDLKIHEDVQGNVFVKASRLSRGRQRGLRHALSVAGCLFIAGCLRWDLAERYQLPPSQWFRNTTGPVTVHPSLPAAECP